MRRDLHLSYPAVFWAGGIRPQAFSLEIASEAHQLLSLAYSDQHADIPDYNAWLTALQTDPEHDTALCYTAWDEQGMVGFVQAWTSAFIKDLVVHPRARHQGIGLNLLSQAFDIFRQRDEAWVDLKVMENNFPARCLYEKAGMRYVQRLEIDQR
jgi:ribosomal protein S18 acetylase RimI-like enzyme